nr:cyclic-phosphate processing receiver domain-containing protein [Gordonia otitidis]
MRLFVDDLRDPPDDRWTVARTSDEALAILRTSVVIEELKPRPRPRCQPLIVRAKLSPVWTSECLLRKRRDLNPRWFYPRSLSRRARHITHFRGSNFAGQLVSHV